MLHTTLELRAVSKQYGWKTALNQITLSFGPNESVAIYGKNGAGKTTLIKILALLMRPSAGDLFFEGQPIKKNRLVYQSRTGYLGHAVGLYGDLSAEENLLFFAAGYQLEQPDKRVKALLKQYGLYTCRLEKVRHLSRGQQQRLALARAIIHEPNLLLLDEPYTGLDLAAAAYLDAIIQSYRSGKGTIIISSHDPEAILPIANRCLLMAEGKIIRDEPVNADNLSVIQKQLHTALGQA